jgi:hypothetical protein
MKETPYFSHDYNPSNDPKMSALISEYGAVGYGIFWCIIEMMHQEDTHKLPLKQYIYIAITKQMQASAKQNQVDAEQVESIIKHCILVCELFVSEGDLFYSNRVMRNFDKRAEISEKRSFAGKQGAIAKQMQASAKQNLAKPSKGNKKKEKEIKLNTFIAPSFEEFESYCKENGFGNIAKRAFDGYVAGDWHDAQGNKILRWKQKLINGWFSDKNKDVDVKQEEFKLPFNFIRPKPF